jgi:hypothetical protein
VKKLLFIGLIAALGIGAMAVQMIGNGKRVLFTFPIGLTENKTFLFPSFDLRNKTFAANDTISVHQLYTYLRVDTLKGTYNVVLNVQQHVTPGAAFYIQFGKDDTVRTAYIKQGASNIDTVSVTGNKIKRWYLFNGSRFEKF